MCGRFFINGKLDTETILAQLQEQYDPDTLAQWAKSGEIFPGSLILTLRSSGKPTLMRWGYQLGKRSLINTRAETIRDKDYYSADFSDHRCLIPASGFYEWDHRKNKYYLHTADPVLYLAGIYQLTADPFAGFSIITRPAVQTLAIHDRVPVILDRGKAAAWLNRAAVSDLFLPSPLFLVEPAGPRLMEH
jgi:putative SOS response-associated peptidase YedK